MSCASPKDTSGAEDCFAGVILGPFVGTDLGAHMANRVGETPHRIVIGFVTAMAVYMAHKALG
jgi:uncharacterized membrane protein YfcA